MTEERKTLGLVYRVVGEFLAQRGVAGAVLSKVSPETRGLVENPAAPFQWHSSRPLEEIERVLFDLPQGRDLCADLGTAASLKLCGSVIAGVLKMAFSLFGQTPASLFANADRLFRMVSTGLAFSYQSAADKSGVVWAEISGAGVHCSLFDQVRGNLRGAFDLCSVRGEVGQPEVEWHDARGARVKYQVSWA